MSELIDVLIEKYGYDEPIFTQELKEVFNMKPTKYNSTLKKLTNAGELVKAKSGIYFIPNPNRILKQAVLSVEKIIRKKYIEDQGEVFGYKTGTNIANLIGLTSQTASVYQVVTNRAESRERKVTYYNNRVIVRKTRVLVNRENYKLLQVLDLINNFDRYSELSLENAITRIVSYLESTPLSKEELTKCINSYPQGVGISMRESGLYEELLRV